MVQLTLRVRTVPTNECGRVRPHSISIEHVGSDAAFINNIILASRESRGEKVSKVNDNVMVIVDKDSSFLDLAARLHVGILHHISYGPHDIYAPPVGPSYAGEGPTPARAKTTLARVPRWRGSAALLATSLAGMAPALASVKVLASEPTSLASERRCGP